MSGLKRCESDAKQKNVYFDRIKNKKAYDLFRNEIFHEPIPIIENFDF